ncbi:Os01g0550050 [Oryza sativa Japonica Group]|uniref:Os01g0550050 protein n=1 Tax=Oryza sativa subsp. japonica TaxID=39947 RepID=A0A0P0V3X1_ORYSJ|nr:Os01g0550050 [Oryza sativa Japonica Group]
MAHGASCIATSQAKTEDEEERRKGWKAKRFDSCSHRLDHASCVASITPLVNHSSLQTLRRKDQSELQKPSRQDRPDEILRLADYHAAGLSSRLVASRRLASQGVEPSRPSGQPPGGGGAARPHRPIDGSAAPGAYRLQPAALLLELLSGQQRTPPSSHVTNLEPAVQNRMSIAVAMRT